MTQILENKAEISQAFKKYLESLDKTNERRILWNKDTKRQIVETLELIVSSFKYDWLVQRLEYIENYQTINVCLNNKGSGMIQNIKDSDTGYSVGHKYIKHGGYLAFCQSYNGNINVIIGFPYIDEWVLPMDTKVIATIEPSQVTEELITEYVITFLQTMTEWEGHDRPSDGYGQERKVVGYKMP
jgi:hypothetical protein